MTPRELPEDARLTPFDVAVGAPLGEYRGAPPLPEVPVGLTPRAALEEAVLGPLQRPPCLVSFSGGRDSSAVLALATSVARREGLPLPIPATYRFPGVPEADESSWQELVIRHLGIDDWQRTDVTDEFEILGPEARTVLGRHGVLLPFNAYAHAPLFRAAAGGSFLTGFDGDGLFGGWRWRRAAGIRGRRDRPRPRDLLSLLLAAAPRRIRVDWVLRRTDFVARPWLRPGVARAVRRGFAYEWAAQPRSWNRRVEWYSRRRAVVVSQVHLALLAQDAGTRLLHPFVEPRFLAALARDGGRHGMETRSGWMRSLFEGLLPEEILDRSSKADHAAAHWGETVSRFVEDWDGSGVDESLVDVAALREAWRSEEWLSATLLQAAWLASRQGRPAASPTTRAAAGA
jgi:asparagine synthase (glutamine-hydrolysing)